MRGCNVPKKNTGSRAASAAPKTGAKLSAKEMEQLSNVSVEERRAYFTVHPEHESEYAFVYGIDWKGEPRGAVEPAAAPAEASAGEPAAEEPEQVNADAGENIIRESVRRMAAEHKPEDILAAAEAVMFEARALRRQNMQTHLSDGRRRGLTEAELQSIMDQLAAPFPPENIEWRIGQSGKKGNGEIWAKALAYIDNRGVMNRLDSVLGAGNWRDEYKVIGPAGEATSGGFLCGISVLIEGEWVTKWDGADWPDTEPFKGAASGAEKRAAVKWGIGRYLYNLDGDFVSLVGKEQKREEGVHYQPQSKGRRGDVEEFYWREPQLPHWALPGGTGEPYNRPRAGAPVNPLLNPDGSAISPVPPATPPPARRGTPPVRSAGYDGTDTVEQLRRDEAARRAGQSGKAQAGGTTAAASPAATETPGASAATAALATGTQNTEMTKAADPANPPTPKQVQFYLQLLNSSCFTQEEKDRANTWLHSGKATLDNMKGQIDWLQRQIATRPKPAAAAQVDPVPTPADPPVQATPTPPLDGAPPARTNYPAPAAAPAEASTALIRTVLMRGADAPAEAKVREMARHIEHPLIPQSVRSEWMAWFVTKSKPTNIDEAITKIQSQIESYKQRAAGAAPPAAAS